MWGNRIEKTLSSMIEAMPSITGDWSAEKQDGAIDIMVGKQMFVQGINKEEIRQVIKPLMSLRWTDRQGRTRRKRDYLDTVN